MPDLVATHRHKADQGWQYYNFTMGRWDTLSKRPTGKLAKHHRDNGWQYYANPAGQPEAIYTIGPEKITEKDRQTLEKLLKDTTILIYLMSKVMPDLPAVPPLEDVRDYLAEILKRDYWLEEIR